MAFVHGKDAVVKVDGDDISPYCNKVEIEREAEAHDVTGFGKDAKVYQGGLLDGEGSLEGTYDSTAGGPRAILEPLLGTVVELIYQPEGVGTGKPTKTVDILVKKYKESTPVADMITWSCDVQLSDAVANTTQS